MKQTDVRRCRFALLATAFMFVPCAASAACLSSGKLAIDIRDCGAHATEEPDMASFDSTSAIRDALDAGNAISIPRGTWRISHIDIPAGKTITTAGFATILRQIPDPKSGGKPGPIVSIVGSNVEMGSFSARGNIATDNGEHNHALMVGGAGPISNIKIGDVAGRDIRGDVLYVTGSPKAPLSNLRFGTITGTNILRSIASITGGVDITGVAIIGGHCGYSTLDIEPNLGSQPPDRISIGRVQGGKLQLASESADRPDLPPVLIGSVNIGALDLNTAYQTPPKPAYVRLDGSPYFDRDIGVLASYWTRLRIGEYRATGRRWSAFYAAPWRGAGAVEIDKYVGSGNGAGNQSTGEFNCEGCSSLRIHSGSTRLYSRRKAFLTRGAATVYELGSFSLSGGPVVRDGRSVAESK